MMNKEIQRRSKAANPLTGAVVREYFHTSEIVACAGCRYWRKFDNYVHACHYCIDTGIPRGIMPKDCYKHEGTPYSLKTKKRDNKNRPLFVNKQMRGEK